MATVTKGKTFISGETVEPADMHQLVDSATVTNIVDADIGSGAAIALSKLATGALPTAITTTTANIVDASVTPAKLSQPPTFATAQASTSGTAIDFTGIPSWAKKITVMFNGVSTSGSSRIVVRLGTSSGVVESGYTSFCGTYGRVTENYQDTASETTGFGWWNAAPVDTGYGHMLLTNISGNTWVASHSGAVTASGLAYVIGGGGVVALASALDRVRITTASGTPTFDTGSINISYEG